jgi:hypothetical protein
MGLAKPGTPRANRTGNKKIKLNGQLNPRKINFRDFLATTKLIWRAEMQANYQHREQI